MNVFMAWMACMVLLRMLLDFVSFFCCFLESLWMKCLKNIVLIMIIGKVVSMISESCGVWKVRKIIFVSRMMIWWRNLVRVIEKVLYSFFIFVVSWFISLFMWVCLKKDMGMEMSFLYNVFFIFVMFFLLMMENR